jgi:hypothetical protein
MSFAGASPLQALQRRPELRIAILALRRHYRLSIPAQPSNRTSVVEEKRKSDGKAEIRSGVLVITFEDDRVERWTPVGRRMVVEHGCPASTFPAGPSVLGIGKRMR